MIRPRKPPRVSDAVRMASYPHPYPAGWYRLGLSRSLRRGQIHYIEGLGGQFVCWRAEDSGEVHVMDAFCPHLGTNLALGRVRGDCIECPFHLWRFTAEGRVDCIPYSQSPPDRVLARTFPVQELHGQIFCYHHAAGQACRDEGDDANALSPPYQLPRIKEVDDGRFVYRGEHNAGRVGMHIIEIAENAVDTAHFQPLHSQFRIPWTRIPVPGIKIEHSVEWMLDDDHPWAMHFLDHAELRVFGQRSDRTSGSAKVSFWGPGSVMTFRFSIPDMGEIAMYQTHLPVGPLEQQVDFRWFADRNVPRLLVWYVIGNWISQWKQDLEIWENKIYRSRPMLCRDDGPVHAMRRWYQQFLPSPSGQS